MTFTFKIKKYRQSLSQRVGLSILSDQWTVRPMDCRTNGLSDHWTGEPVDCMTLLKSVAAANHSAAIQWICRTSGLSSQWTCGISISPTSGLLGFTTADEWPLSGQPRSD